MKTLLLSTAIATFAAIGTAAAQPFDMSRDQADRVTAAGGPTFSLFVEKGVQEQVLKLFAIKAQLESKPNIKGHFAHAEAGDSPAWLKVRLNPSIRAPLNRAPKPAPPLARDLEAEASDDPGAGPITP